MNFYRKLAVLLVLAVMASSLSACSIFSDDDKPTYEELESQLNSAYTTISSRDSEITSLKQLLYTYDSTLSEVQNLNSVRTLPTGQQVYNAINGSIRIGEQLDLEPSMVLPNDTTITLVPNVEYKPSNNWSFNLSNGNVSLQHKNGMYVTLRAYNYVGSENAISLYDAFIKPYADKLAVKELKNEILFLNTDTAGTLATYQCYVVSDEQNPEVKEIYDPNPSEPETTESMPETYENGILVETESETNADGAPVETVAESDATAESTQVDTGETPLTGGTSLSDLLGGGGTESTSAAGTESSSASTEGTDGATESSSSDTTAGTSTPTSEASATETLPVSTEGETNANTAESQENLQEYRYILGIVLDNSTAIVIEAFYPQDENADIQEELLNTCLGSLSVRDRQLRAE